jgi:hypothetical protein
VNKIETGITLEVYADPEYFYEVHLGGEYTLTYKETDLNIKTILGFGSLEEMEAVANAMLKAVKIKREMP